MRRADGDAVACPHFGLLVAQPHAAAPRGEEVHLLEGVEVGEGLARRRHDHLGQGLVLHPRDLADPRAVKRRVSAGGSQAPGPDPQPGDAVGGGNDRLFGGNGDDIITGDSFAPNGHALGGGNDQVYGGDGNDPIAGDSNTKDGTASGGGNDLLVGGDGNESLVGDSHSIGEAGDVIGAGNDVLEGGPGLEVMNGDSEGRNASGSGGDDVLDLGADGGLFAAGDHISAVGNVSGAGNDTIIGGDAPEFPRR